MLAGIITIFLSLVSGCKEKYEPPEVLVDNKFLVVDGFINSGGDQSILKLSRTRTLADKNLISPELNAQISVEEEGGGIIGFFQDQGNGQYGIPPLSLNAQKKYRINIHTSSGGDYQSDFVPVKYTPPIDSISWGLDPTGLTVYANTHDPQNNTRYYRYEYEETWEHHSEYEPYLQYLNGQVVFIDPLQAPFKCWTSNSSTDILLASTAKLQDDILYHYPLTFIPMNTERISVKYSILVKQYALTDEAFLYWTSLRKNTEQLGTLFDPQPSQLTGNIHSVSNPAEVVLGFITASSVQQSRIYISNDEVAPWKLPRNCIQLDIPSDSIAIYFGMWGYAPVASNGLFRFYAAEKKCLDCRLQGGTTTKPSFWP